MCGRYYLKITIDKLIERYGILNNEMDSITDGEIFPSNRAPVIIQQENKKELRLFKWGFKPSFTNRLIINARAETIDKKPTFKNAFFGSRCLVPASSFFEWQTKGKQKIKYKISLKNMDIFSLAGIFDIFKDDNGNNIQSFTVITTEPNNKLKKIHNRMPVIIPRENEDYWLDNNPVDFKILKDMLRPYPEEALLIEPDSDQLKLNF